MVRHHDSHIGFMRPEARRNRNNQIPIGYVWRGISVTNRPVGQPNACVAFPAGATNVTLGGWVNVDLGQYGDTDDPSRSGGVELPPCRVRPLGRGERAGRRGDAHGPGRIGVAVPLGSVSLALGALAALIAGQAEVADPDELNNFAENGFTHLDLSASVPFSAGIFSLTGAASASE
jgi:hypothetical protein